MSGNCYTYLIGWTSSDRWYYGVRYAYGCDPSDLWVTYFTSSNFVKRQRQLYGDPDVIQIRRVFGNNSKMAKLWEERVLRRVKVLDDPKWLNRSNNNSFRGVDGPWNRGLTKDTCPSVKMASIKISQQRKTRTDWKTGKYVRTEEANATNSWRQLLSNPHIAKAFTNYDYFCDFCCEEYTVNKRGVWTIARELKLGDVSSVITALRRNNIEPTINQSWTKILKRHPNFPFSEYDDLCKEVVLRVQQGDTIWRLSKEFKLSEDAIKRAFKHGESLPVFDQPLI